MTLVSPPNNHISPDEPTLFGEAGYAVMINHHTDAPRNVSVSRNSNLDEDDDSTEPNDSRSQADLDSLPTDRGNHDEKADVANGVGVDADPDSSRSTKRRRLTAEEREERQREKDMKTRQRAEMKAKRDEERQVKEAEKRQKDTKKQQQQQEREADRRKKAIEREEKRLAKVEEQKEKEEARRKKDGAKESKDRSQLRLNAFFPGAKETTSSEKTKEDKLEAASAEHARVGPRSPTASRSTFEPHDVKSRSPTKSTNELFDEIFQPFFQKAHVSWAAQNRFQGAKDLPAVRDTLDEALGTYRSARHSVESVSIIQPNLRSSFKAISLRRLTSSANVKDIVAAVQRAADPLSFDNERPTRDPICLLDSLPIKALQYFEDVRPPYRGTFSKQPPAGSRLRLGRCPFERSLPDTDYDYDSEVEWENPEDGDDVDVESEEDVESEDDGEMDEFLDDAETDGPPNKRRMVLSDLEPICSGLRWEGVDGQLGAKADEAQSSVLFGELRMELLNDAAQTPIDPFSARYWHPVTSAKSSACIDTDPSVKVTMKEIYPMDPPRLPLHAVGSGNTAINRSTLVDSTENLFKGAGKGSKRGKVLLAQEHMPAFKETVRNSDLTKTGLIEVLKKRLPKVPKDVIKDTLNAYAARVGVKEVDKRWRLVGDA